jgi:hypothetical protein
MPYDALGNYVPGDDTDYTPKQTPRGKVPDPAYMQIPTPNPAYGNVPNVDEMRMALGAMKSANFKDPLAKTHRRFAELQADIAELPKQISDVTNTLFGNPTAVAALQPWEAMLKHAYKMPGIMYREQVAKDPQSLREAAQMRKDLEGSVGEKGWFPTQPLQTQGGEEFASNVGKAFEESKLPPWPMVGGMAESVIGMPQRRMLAPSDVRALSGDAARLATQVKEIAPDFQAAQTGFKRMDPITGQPTLGAKAQSLMDDWANVLERRQSVKDEVSPFAEATSPEMYAMRKKGTKLIEPTRPETAAGASFSVDPAVNIVREAVGGARDLAPYPLYREWRNAVADDLPARLNDDMRKYANMRKAAMYPDLSPSQANKAFDLEFADRDANAKKLLEFYTDYLNSPEARDLAQQNGANIVTPAEFAERHTAAVDWLQGPYSNYIVRNIGAEGDPLVDLAAKGITYLPATEIRDLSVFAEPEQVQAMREKAGLPREGTVGAVTKAKMAELVAAQQELRAMEDLRADLYDQAREQGIDPASISEYAALTTPVRNKGRQVQQLENEIDKLQTGVAYEALTDISVMPRTPEEFLSRDIDEYEKPFYPAATRAKEGETVYPVRSRLLGTDLGFSKLAKDIYKDVIAGDVSLDQLKNLTVPKYVTKSAEKRMVKEAQQAKEQQEVKSRILDAAKEQLNAAQLYLPNSHVIEITNAMSPEEVAKLLSMDTIVLNHCVGSCGTPPEGTRNLFTNERQNHKSLFDFAKNEFIDAGERLRDRGYVRDIIGHNDMITSMRDSNTGLPVATIQFNRLQNGKYSLGYVSGNENGPISPQYNADVATYLNKYADQIVDTGQLSGHAGVFDTTQHDKFRTLAYTAEKETNVPLNIIRSIDYDFIPRFVTQEQFNDFVIENSKDIVAPTPRHEITPDDIPAPDVIPPDYLNDPQQLLAYGERRLQELDNINRQVAELEYRAAHQGLTQQDRNALATLQADQADYRAIIRAVNARFSQLQQLQPPPAEVQVPAQQPDNFDFANTMAGLNNLEFEVDWADPANRGAVLQGDVPMPEQVTRMDNTQLLHFLTPEDFQEASTMITHIQEQLNDIEETTDEIHAEDAQRDYLDFLRNDATATFGEVSPYTLEYAIRVAEGRMGNPRQQGFAKGGAVRIAKTIPAMRAELRRM